MPRWHHHHRLLAGAAHGYVNRLLVAIGTVVILIGLAWPWLKRLPLFRLPGDIVIDRPGVKFFFPITTMLLVSALVSLLAWIFRR